jgi:hypothetical protein
VAVAGSLTFYFWTLDDGSGGVPLPRQSQLRATQGRLQQGRRSHTATLLPNGTVLIAGGFTQGTTVTDRVELYDPATETFTTLTGRMTQPRANFTATLLQSGKVLFAGGWYEVSAGNLNSTLTAEVYDPVAATSHAVGNLHEARVDAAALRLPDGRVLVTGGSQLIAQFLADLDDAEAFDPTTETFAVWASSMTHTRATHTMTDLGDGRWLVEGGSDTDFRGDLFTIGTGLFTPVAAAAGDLARFGLASAPFADGDVAIVGGEAQGTVLHFDRPLAKLLNTGSGTTTPRAYATASPIADDQVLVVGGIDYSNGGFVLATVDLVLQGGVAGSKTYATSVRFPTGIANHTATVLLDGRVLFVGGVNPIPGQSELDGAYLFTPN